jgi:hypothetical protein
MEAGPMTGSATSPARRNAAQHARSRSFAAVAFVLFVAACGSASSQTSPKLHASPKLNVQQLAPPSTEARPTTPSTEVALTVPRTPAATVPPTVAVTVPATVAPTAPATMAPPTTAAANPSIKLVAETGVSPAELDRADTLVESTIVGLQRYEYPQEAYAAGYRSIGDASTGDEHYVNWSYVDDGHILDPTRPESVVYENRGGKQVAVAAMYMLPFDSTFADVPDVGGALTQWHVHRDLCLTESPTHKVLSGSTSPDGTCPPGTNKAGNTPMLHVWIVPNQCGPFAALEGVGAGQVPAGQTRNCDTTHASTP